MGHIGRVGVGVFTFSIFMVMLLASPTFAFADEWHFEPSTTVVIEHAVIINFTDSTAPRSTLGIIALHFADILMIFDRQGKKDFQVSYHPGTTPFCHRLTDEGTSEKDD